MRKVRVHLEKIEIIFVAIAVLFGLIFSITTPPFWGVDEPAHFFRAYQIADGKLKAEPKKIHKQTLYTAAVPAQFVRLGELRANDIITSPPSTNIINQKKADSSTYQSLLSQKINKKTVERVDITGASAYSPIAYAVPAASIFIVKSLPVNIETFLILVRVSSLVVYTALVLLALIILRKSAYKYVLFFIGLLPVTLFQASVVTADWVANALALLLAACVIRMYTLVKLGHTISTLEMATFVITLVTLPLIKQNYVILSLGLLLLPIYTVLPKNGLFSSLSLMKKKIVLLVLILAPFLIWLAISLPVSKAIGASQRAGMNISTSEQVIDSISHPNHPISALAKTLVINGDNYVSGVVGLLGATYTPPPIFTIILAYIVVLVLLVKMPKLIPTKQAYILLGVVVLALLSIFGVLYVSYNPVGSSIIEGVQSRYFIPLIPFLCLAFASIFGNAKVNKATASSDDNLATRQLVYLVGASVLILSYNVLYYVLVLY